MPVAFGGAAKRAKREAVELIGGHPKPRGGVPRGCTWDYTAGVWRDAHGEQRASNQTRLNQAAHRHLPGERSRLKAARMRAAPYPRAPSAAPQPTMLFADHGKLMQLVRPRARVVSVIPIARAREGTCAGTHHISGRNLRCVRVTGRDD